MANAKDLLQSSEEVIAHAMLQIAKGIEQNDRHLISEKFGILNDDRAARLIDVHQRVFLMESDKHYFWSDCEHFGRKQLGEHYHLVKKIFPEATTYEEGLAWIQKENDKRKHKERIDSNEELALIVSRKKR
jgi:hypothetical protein